MISSDQQHTQKQQVAEAALAWVSPDNVLGVGTGSTVNCFIDALAASGIRIEAAVSSSEATTKRLQSQGIHVRELNLAGTVDVYIDGADEFDAYRRLIKGGGGALTREKIIAGASRNCAKASSPTTATLSWMSTIWTWSTRSPPKKRSTTCPA